MEVDEKQNAEDDVEDHLREERGKLTVNGHLVEVEVEDVLTEVGFFELEDLEVVLALGDLVLLALDHHDRVQEVQVLQLHEELNY